jgi:parallel beta-helix repeat protein
MNKGFLFLGIFTIIITSQTSFSFNLRSITSETAASPIVEWSKTFGGMNFDYAWSVCQTDDGGYIIGGGTSSFGAGDVDIWLVKTDSTGSIQWNKTIGDIGPDGEGFGSIHQTKDGGYIFTASYCKVVNGIATSKGFWLFKTDSFGNLQWKKPDVGNVVGLTEDGGYITAGGKDGVILVKIDIDGNLQWEENLGRAANIVYVSSVQQTTDGGYIVAGTDYSENVGFLVKTDLDAKTQWNKTYGGLGHHYIESAYQTADGGYVFAGTADSDAWLVKTDSSGNSQWNRTFGGAEDDGAYSVEGDYDGYIIAGWTDSFGGGGGFSDFWLIRVDSAGNEEWNRTFGGAEDDFASFVQKTLDGGYIVAGYTDSYGAGDRDAWVVKLAHKTWIVDDDNPADFNSIQEAINTAISGDIVFVCNGTYYENVIVNKTISLIGENRNTTIIDGGGVDSIVKIEANDITITSFTIQNGTSGISASFFNSITISANTIIDNQYDGIFLGNSNNDVAIDNIMRNNNRAIYINSGTNNTLFGNRIFDNREFGIVLWECGTGNAVLSNFVANNTCNIGLIETGGAIIHHNSFFRKDVQVYGGLLNIWDDGYPSGGNFWSDYTGVDMKSGFYQNETGSDGIGDSNYTIDANNNDRYPLMGPISFFDAGTWNDINYYVSIVSNSTVSHFHFDPDEGPFVSFWVKGETETETFGFCRVAIPNDLLWVEDGWTVLYGSYPLSYNASSDYNYTYLYFNYTNPSLNVFTTVTIYGTGTIPEFPSLLTLPIFMIATLLAVIVYKRKHQTLCDEFN